MQSRILAILLALSFSVRAFAQTQDVDAALASLADKLAIPVHDHEKKKIAVIDFTNLDGKPSGELGKYIAEQLSVDLVMGKRDFSVLDRANLKSILAEHKLTATGLIDPDTAKKLGQFAGVDALILGTIVPKSQTVSVTAKIITTDTAELIGAAKGEFKQDETVKGLLAHEVSQESSATAGAGILDSEDSDTVKTFGDLKIQVEPMRIIQEGAVRLNLTLSNTGANKSLWVALKDEGQTVVNGRVTDSGGGELRTSAMNVSGLVVAFLSNYNNGRMIQATQIRAGDSVSVKINFVAPYSGQHVASGMGKLQLKFLVATSWTGSALPTSHNLITKLEIK